MRNTFIFVLSMSLLKAAPILQSIIIINVSGAEYYAYLGYYIVLASFLASLLVTGVVPVYARRLGQHGSKASVETTFSNWDFVSFLGAATISVFVIALSVEIFGLMPNHNSLVGFSLAVASGLTGVLTPLLLLLGRKQIVVTTLVFCLALSIVTSFAANSLPVHQFQYIFCLPPLILVAIMAVTFSRAELSKDRHARRLLSLVGAGRVAKEIAPVFVPNVFWMLMLFWFSKRIAVAQSDQADFAWYVVGLQIFSVMSFIPSSIAPLLTLRMSANNQGGAYAAATRLAFGIIAVGVGLLIAILAFASIVPDSLISVTQQNIWLPMIAAGCIAATFAPLNAYLVAQRGEYWILAGALCWTVVAHGLLTLRPHDFAIVFLMAYSVALVALLATTRIVHSIRTSRGD